MIRFVPDDWIDVLMRPFDMVSPEANTYVEIAAPDIRLAAAFVLALAAVLLWRRLRPGRARAFTLLALLLLAAAPWLYTTGNGRYFLPFLLLSGPLCAGLVRLLPATGGLRLTLLGLLVGTQGFFLSQVVPWKTWSLGTWADSTYFPLEAPPSRTDVNYLTISNISYSLIAPQFPPQAGWASLATGLAGEAEREALRRMLGSPRRLVLVAPSIPSETTSDGRPSPRVREALDDLMAVHGLSLVSQARCSLLRSKGLAAITLGVTVQPDQAQRVGFWLCPVRWDPASARAPATPQRSQVDSVFEAVERLCPRFFRPGEAASQRIAGGYVRQYAGSDTKVYIFDTGQVLYKFWRSVNPVLIGSKEQVLAGQVQVDCARIRAPNWRKGGP